MDTERVGFDKQLTYLLIPRSSISPPQLPRFRTEPAKPLDELGGTFAHISDSRLDIEDRAQTTSIRALANTLISSQVNVPKTRNTYCKGRTCKKHTQHKVTQYKAGKVGSPLHHSQP